MVDTAGSANITGAADLATTAVTASPAGNYPITVTDAGNLAAPNYDFPTADFKSGTLTVTARCATVAVGSTLPNSTYGQSVSFTVTVSGGGPTPPGTVQFVVDGTDLGSPVTLSGWQRNQPEHDAPGRGQPHGRGPVFGRSQLCGQLRQLHPGCQPGALEHRAG